MIAHDSLGLFDPVLAHLPRLVAADTLIAADAPLARDAAFLDPAAHPADPGQAAIVAVIDHAIPFAHPLLRTVSGHSRVAAIWLMEAEAIARRPDIPFGRELRGTEIDALRDPGDPDAAYRVCGLMQPGRCMSMAAAASHGAAVAALAAGHDPTDPAGRNHPLVAVSLPRVALAETSGSLGGLFIQAAVIFVVARARALSREMSQRAGRRLRPALVVNLSLGVTAGADDGSALISYLQDRVSASARDDLGQVHFVLPTGNNRQDRLRAHLRAGQQIGWQIPPGDPTPNAVEIWAAAGQDAPRIAIQTPDGACLTLPVGSTGAGRVTDAQGQELARVVLQRRRTAAGGRACLTVIVPPSLPRDDRGAAAPPGLWLLHLLPGRAPACDLLVHRDDALPGFRGQGKQSRLVDPGYSRRLDDGRWPGGDDPQATGLIRRNGTASTYARGLRQIRAGASYAHPAGQISPYTGLLPDGMAGDVTAPADRSAAQTGMILPGIRGATRQRLSGTSLSAPQVTRWLAAALAGGAAIPDRAALRRALGAGPCDGPPDLGAPVLPWRCGLDPAAAAD
jgi:hypothetical protein